MSPFHVPTTSLFHIPVKFPHYFYLPATFPVSRRSNVSLFHVPETFPYFMSLQHVAISHPCNMVPFHFPCSMSLFHVLTTYLIPLEHVLISHPWDILINFHVTLRYILISHPCDMSLFYTPATCLCFTSLQQVSILCPCNMYPFHAPALRVGTIVLSFLAGSVNFITIMTTIIILNVDNLIATVWEKTPSHFNKWFFYLIL